jgi:hypothetical protein
MISGTNDIGHKLYRLQFVSGTNCIVLEYLEMHKEEEAFVEFTTEIQDLVVYVERTWVGSVRQLNKRQIITFLTFLSCRCGVNSTSRQFIFDMCYFHSMLCAICCGREREKDKNVKNVCSV